MENFNNVPSSGTFGSVVSVVNQNFALAKEAIDKLAFSKSACMGFYETSSELNDAHPTPTDGDWALVGDSSPFNVYVANDGSWVDSGVDYNVSVDNSIEINGLGGYVVLDSVQELPASPSNPNIGYLIGTHLYVYVGTGGDTLDGKYKDCGEFRGPTGDQGVGFASASSPATADGTWQIKLTNGDTITIDLNHVHPQYETVSPITNAASGALVVNEYRDFGSVSALTVTLSGGTMTNYDLYKFAFTCASDATTLTLPSGVKLPVDMEMEMAAGRRFECVIDYANCLTFNCWD